MNRLVVEDVDAEMRALLTAQGCVAGRGSTVIQRITIILFRVKRVKI